MSYFNSPMDLWSVTGSGAGAQQAIASKALGAAGVRHVAKRVIITAATTGTVQPAIQVNLRDGASGLGTVLASWQVGIGLSTALSGVCAQNIDVDNLNLVGTSATAMTLEFSGAAAAATTTSVTLIGYDFGVKPTPIPGFVV